MSRKIDQVFNDILVMLALEGDRQALDKLARRWWPRHYTHARNNLKAFFKDNEENTGGQHHE